MSSTQHALLSFPLQFLFPSQLMATPFVCLSLCSKALESSIFLFPSYQHPIWQQILLFLSLKSKYKWSLLTTLLLPPQSESPSLLAWSTEIAAEVKASLLLPHSSTAYSQYSRQSNPFENKSGHVPPPLNPLMPLRFSQNRTQRLTTL